MVPTNSKAAFKKAARLLMAHLQKHGMPAADHASALHALSAAHDIRNWNTMSALLDALDKAHVPAARQEVQSRGITGGNMFTEDVGVASWLRFMQWCRQRAIYQISISPEQVIWGQAEDEWHKLSTIPMSQDSVSGIITLMCEGRTPGESMTHLPSSGIWEARRHEGTGNPMRVQYCVSTGRAQCPRIDVYLLGCAPFSVQTMCLETELLTGFRPVRGVNIFSGAVGNGVSALMAALIRWRCQQVGANEKVVDMSYPDYVYDNLNFPDSILYQIGAASLTQAFRMHPTMVVDDRMHVDGNMATMVDEVSRSTRGMLGLMRGHATSVALTLQRLMFVMSDKNAREAMFPILNMVCCQLLVPRMNGGKVALRETLVLDDGMREELLRASFSGKQSVVDVARRMLMERGGTIGMQAQVLQRAGVLSTDIAQCIARREC